MLNPDQIQFLEACRRALEDESFKRAVFTGAKKGKDKFQAKFDLVLGEKNRFIDYSDTNMPTPERSKLDVNVLSERMSESPVAPFRAALLCTTNRDYHYAENRKGVSRLYQAKATMKNVDQQHNRNKNYVLTKDRPYLTGLGVANGRGEIVKKHYSKFRQIANFVEIIDRDIGTFVREAEEPISILDLGCGKGYLTFAAYDYVRSNARREPLVRGIDIKPNVIDLCNGISEELKFEGLVFENAYIQPDEKHAKIGDLDILIALHACDTATDDALALGLRSRMKFFFCAPCCQAQIAAQIVPQDSGASKEFGLINQFPLMKRRQADIVTDVCRALLLQSFGYNVKFLEFTPLEHTLKNVMLVGKLDPSVDREQAWRDYEALKVSYGFKIHALEENTCSLR
ncbi:MAG: class I SAM-dependent methyltransferase [Rhizobiaceae bacterium]